MNSDRYEAVAIDMTTQRTYVERFPTLDAARRHLETRYVPSQGAFRVEVKDLRAYGDPVVWSNP